MRHVSHVAWHIITLITIPLFIIAAAFGTIGTIMVYIPTMVNIIFSPAGLNSILGSGESVDIINQCVNGGGNLETIIISNSDSDLSSTLDTFYNATNFITQMQANLTANENSQVITYYISYFTQMKTDIVIAGGTDSNAPSAVLGQLDSYTSKNAASSQQSSCSQQTDDLWVSNNTLCQSGYTYTASTTPTSNIGSSCCLNINDWTSSTIAKRYASRPTSCSNSLVLSTTASNYVSDLNSYESTASPILDSIDNDLAG